jgi:hypothetical protein
MYQTWGTGVWGGGRRSEGKICFENQDVEDRTIRKLFLKNCVGRGAKIWLICLRIGTVSRRMCMQ